MSNYIVASIKFNVKLSLLVVKTFLIIQDLTVFAPSEAFKFPIVSQSLTQVIEIPLAQEAAQKNDLSIWVLIIL